jgi:hypothetical protein
MATLIELKEAKAIIKLDPELDPDFQEDRLIYMSPGLDACIKSELGKLESALGLQLSPEQQFDALVEVFCSGEPLLIGEHFKCLHHIKHAVWELRTPDLRVFGWFPQKDCFVGVFAHDATYIKQHDLYRGYITQTVRFRDLLDLDEPKFIAGDNPHDVVSNANYPK